ncbi:hypothetical protein BO83DRAFT_223514 [Aspergillus eucalypticola CBS 122712]|uniref:Rhodopsin domain-containing protein n=1 Tax=Aspergillus eucalypticola (strain CBS 122712 / IBT 29274) TaxID=1448314 RepID=A0A317VTS5_ASPEC|nr:uncharacterized protein BO83DRAFT_223514 [Aspergillus eucalypticola CBS 122712]PWY77716.1 hypothetical protein BO83DRAFT_223514 [Aspergillus eucalypticola CBS 122712]
MVAVMIMSDTYANPASIIRIPILFPILGTLTVTLRFYTRRKTKFVLWIDDWLTLPALGLEYVLATLMLWGATTGSLGSLLLQPDDPRPDAYIFSNSDPQIRLLQIQYVADIVTVWAFGFAKLSILYFYRSIFCSRRTIRTAFHSVTMCMIVLVSVWTVVFGIGTIFICGAHPVNPWGTIAVFTSECSLHVPIVEGHECNRAVVEAVKQEANKQTWAVSSVAELLVGRDQQPSSTVCAITMSSHNGISRWGVCSLGSVLDERLVLL